MLSLGGFFQIGYVTTDLERSVDLYARRFGAPNWFTFDTGALNPDRPYASFVGLAWIGAVQVELIQPKNVEQPLYADAMPKGGFGINLHHLGYLLDSEAEWDAATISLAALNIPVASRSTVEGVVEVLYADARPVLGHYLEYVWPQADGRKFLLDNVPRNRGDIVQKLNR